MNTLPRQNGGMDTHIHTRGQRNPFVTRTHRQAAWLAARRDAVMALAVTGGSLVAVALAMAVHCLPVPA